MPNKKYVTLFILLLIFVLRIPHISNSPFEAGEIWRQGDTESMARNFVTDRFNILYPQLNYDGPPPNYAQLEFQIMTFLIAILYKLFGFHYVLARLVPILFFIGSVYFLYLIAKKYYSVEIAWIAMILYGIFPLTLFFSRAIMPESVVLFFMIGAFYFFSEWMEKERNWMIVVAAMMTMFAILVKIPAIFIGIPMLVMSIMKFKYKIVVQGKLWFFAFVSLLPPFVYFQWLSSVAEFKFVNGIGSKHVIPQFATAIISDEAMAFFTKHLISSFTWPALILFVIGLVFFKWKKEYPIMIWALAMLLEVVTIVAVIRLPYYLLLASPVVALLAAKGFAYLLKWKYKLGMAIIGLVLLLTGWHSFSSIASKYEEKENILNQAEVIQHYTNEDDLIIISTLDPALLNASGRKGWRANINYYDYIPHGPKEELAYFISHGAKYFFPVNGYIYGDGEHKYKKYLEENFKKIKVIIEGKDYSFYQLQ